MKRLLIIYHSQGGKTERMAQAVLQGAQQEENTTTRLQDAFHSALKDLLECDGVIFGSPENFGYMSGAMKDFFDRTYYPAQEHALNLPYALFIGAGNDGAGATQAMQRILTGYPMRAVAEPVIARGELRPQDLENCSELGLSMAAGLAMGIF